MEGVVEEAEREKSESDRMEEGKKGGGDWRATPNCDEVGACARRARRRRRGRRHAAAPAKRCGPTEGIRGEHADDRSQVNRICVAFNAAKKLSLPIAFCFCLSCVFGIGGILRVDFNFAYSFVFVLVYERPGFLFRRRHPVIGGTLSGEGFPNWSGGISEERATLSKEFSLLLNAGHACAA